MLLRSVLAFGFVTLLLLSNLSLSFTSEVDDDGDDNEDLSLLQEADQSPPDSDGDHGSPSSDEDEHGSEDAFLGDNEGDLESEIPAVDDKDVVVLKKSNFSDFVNSHRFVMVEFYAPWCGHCQTFAPEYAAIATQIKEDGVDVVIAKVDGTEESELADEYKIQGFPSIFMFSDGVHKSYEGARSKEAILSYIEKKMGPGIRNLTTLDEAEKVLSSESTFVVGYLNSLVGPESQELVAAARLDDDINFYQTVNPDLAKLFHLDPKSQRPALILIKKEDEKLSYFDSNFSKPEIAEFVLANKLPLVTIFTRENAGDIFDSEIKKQIILFQTSNATVNIIPIFQEVSKSFKGKILFVYLEMDNEDFGKPITDYFGISGTDTKVLGYTGNEEAKKFEYHGEFTVDSIKKFAADFLEDNLKPFYKSEPVPETNDGDVKIVVGNNFDEIVLDESKDVLLEIYAPWCGHCQSLEPVYNKLAKHLRGIDSLVIAKMDGTNNEHPRAKQDGYPTILFFPAGNKSFDPVTVEGERTVVGFYKFLKKHASIPFKLQQKPASKTAPDSSKPASDASTTTTDDSKDEL